MKITVGMAVAGDFYGPFYTIQALRLYHPEILDRLEVVVVCNTPDAKEGENLKRFVQGVPDARFIPYTAISGTAAPRQQVFEHAAHELVLCLDSHVFVAPGAITRLLNYYEQQGPDCADMLQGPFLYDALDPNGIETHMDPVWRSEMFGIWGHDPRGDDPNGEPFEIQMHGLGLFAMLKQQWPGFSPHFKGFGGEEGYIHEKVRRIGGKVLCAPWLRWWHSFWRVGGIPYRCVKEDKLRNNLIVARELGWDHRPAFEHFTQLSNTNGPVPLASAEQIWREVHALPIEEFRPQHTAVSVVEPKQDNPLLPFVSCLMPTYGRASLCAEAIACYGMQDYPADRRELIILNTHEVPLAFENPPEGVRVLNQLHGERSLGELRTLLLAEARGELVQHWDDDDWRLPWSVSQGVAGVARHPGDAAWKPDEHWFVNRGHPPRLARNVCEASITFRTHDIRSLGYQRDCPAGQEMLAMIGSIEQQRRFRVESRGYWASYVYRWGQGVDHVSVGAAADWRERLRLWRLAHHDHGGGIPISIAEAARRAIHGCRALSSAVSPNIKQTWLARMDSIPIPAA